jgi:hypothetical protein
MRGSDKGRHEVVLKQLQLKLGPLNEAVVARVQALHDPAAVDRLVEGILSATSLAELGLA